MLLAGALALGAATVITMAGPATVHADDNALILPGGGTQVTLGANAVLRVDGRLRYVNWCDQMPAPYRNTAINDFVYPATDIYVVEGNPAEAEGVLYAKLEDVAGSPSTVVQGGTAFIEHLIAITGPTGALGEGTYSIVFDTCQDGYFQRAYGDEVWPDAITVVYPPVIPEVSDSIAALKSNAHTEWGTWQQVGRVFDTLLNVEKLVGCGTKAVGRDALGALDSCLAVLKIWVDSPTVQAWIEAYDLTREAAECGSGNPGACFGILSSYWGPKMQSPRDIVAGGAKNLIANQAKSFFGMYADPPRADFTTPTSAAIADLPVPVIQGDSPTFDALSRFASALEREQILNTALLAAVERYQGAQAAGDPVAAVAQARSAAGIAAALAEARPVTVDLLDTFAATVDAEVPGLDDLNQEGHNELNRVRSFGPNADESRTLRNYGMSTPDQIAYVNELRNPGRVGLHAWPLGELNTHITRLEASEADRVGDFTAAAADLAALADSISGPGVEAVPSIAIDPVTPFGVGDVVDVTATASAGATVTWDLDADGAFGDAPAGVTFYMPGRRVIAARATNADGVTVTAHALVDVSATNAPPVIDTADPADEIFASAVGGPVTFTVTASDPDDDPADLTYQWYLDGTAIDQATGPTVTITPTPAHRGARTVSVTVYDTQPGNVAQRAWRWQVSDVDLDGDGWAANVWADCDDANPNRSPSLVEQLYNGIDDDCSDATPDEPLELAVGQLWGWGTGDGGRATGDNRASTTPHYSGIDNVAQVSAAFLAGALLDDTGCVWGWGSGPMPGNGDATASQTITIPTPVVAPGTGVGGSQLCGITQIDAAHYWIGALTADGRVLTWGRQSNGNVGQGISHQAQLGGFPVPGYVVTADLVDADEDGNLDPGTPLEGVVAVEASYGSGFALLEDGTVWRWGSGRCSEPTASVYHAVPMPVLDKPGTTIVQIEGGNQSVLARHSDGTVTYCFGTGANSLRRLTLATFATPEHPEGQRAIDLATTPNSTGAYVLTEDGSLWVTGQPLGFQIEPVTTEEPVTTTTWTRVILPDGAKVIDLDGADVPCAILARRADGSAWSWGDYNRDCHGQGNATVLSAQNHVTPGRLAIAGEVRQVSDGGWHGLAVVGREGADVWTWGTGGALGRTGTNAGQTPGPVPGLTNVVELVATGDAQATYALKADGSVVGFTSGQAGTWYFTATSNNTVQPVKGIGGIGALDGVTHLVSGRGTVAALMADGRVVTWGFGQDALGGGPDAPLNRFFPDYVLGPDLEPITDVVELWGGASGYVARQADGTLLQWGRRDCAGHSIGVADSTSDVAVPPDAEWPADLVQYASDSAPNPLGIGRLADGSVMTCGEQSGVYHLQPVPGFGPGHPAVDVATGANQTRAVVTAAGEVWLKTGFSALYEALEIPANTWTEMELPEGALAVGITINDGSFQIRLADGALLTFGTSHQYQTGRGPSDTPGLGADWRILPAWVDGFVLDSVVETWNAAALVIPDTLVQRTGWVPPQPAVAVSALAGSGPEGGTATAGVGLSQAAPGDVTVSWEFEGVTGSTVMPAGETSAEIVLDLPEADGVWGVDRALPLVLTGVDAGAVLAGEAAEIAVTDTDPPPVLTLAPASVPEGSGALEGRTVTVTATGSVPGIDVPVSLTSADGTAVAGTDFKEVAFDLVLPALETSVTAPLVVLGDAAPEPDRAFTLTATPNDGRIPPVTAGVTILDDDPVALTATGDRVPAGQAATVTVAAPNIPAGETVAVEWSTLDLSAVAGEDYTATAGTVALTGNAEGVGTGTIPVATLVAADDGETRHLLVALDAAHATREVFAPATVIVELTRPLAEPPPTPAPTATPTPSPTATPSPTPTPTPSPTATPSPTPPTTAVIPVGAARYVPIAPARLFDTRDGEPAPGPKGRVGPDSSIDVPVAGRLGIPADAVSVVLNVTVTDTLSPGFVTVYPTGIERPLASSINNIQPGQTRPNLVTVPLGAGGQVTVYSLGSVNVLADVAGYYLPGTEAVAGGRFIALTPQRLFDTRESGGKLGAGGELVVPVTGTGDIPATGVSAVVVNLTGTEADDPGFLTAFPTGQELPLASNVNLSDTGSTAPNLAIVPIGADGTITVYSSHGAHVLGDVTGYITDASADMSVEGLFVPIAPERVFDTRDDPTYQPDPGTTVNIPTAGTGHIPATAVGVVLNITGVDAPFPGFLTAWPTGTQQPLASTLNFWSQPTDTRANAAMLPLGTGGAVSFYTYNGGHILADATGYYIGPAGA